MLLAPIVKRFVGPLAAIGLAAGALSGCSAGTEEFNVGGCLSPDSIRQGQCTPEGDVSSWDYYDQGLSCMTPVGATIWPSQWGIDDREGPPLYDPDKAEQRWYCANPSKTY